ncbi:hypothetical protein [Blautia marasmi]|uniref:hypothetical protein n=1 Tax=Blautia marasmi TaxID=1917868 RepID=UPI00266D052F|nr:hypothetical protein [Blautia marasmi]
MSNYSAGLRIYCADRKKTFNSQAKIPPPKAILRGFLLVTVKVLNSYIFETLRDMYFAGKELKENALKVERQATKEKDRIPHHIWFVLWNVNRNIQTGGWYSSALIHENRKFI